MDWEKYVSTEEQKKARILISKLDRRFLPTFERSGSEKSMMIIVDKNSPNSKDTLNAEIFQNYFMKKEGKDPYTSAYTESGSVKPEIFTDGSMVILDSTRSQKEKRVTYKISNYTYILKKIPIVKENKVVSLKQEIITKSYYMKEYCRFLLGII